MLKAQVNQEHCTIDYSLGQAFVFPYVHLYRDGIISS